MTGRTHDLAAFTVLSVFAATQHLPHMTMGTLLIAISANLIGGLAPDIDQPTAVLWRRLPAGEIFGGVFAPLFGGHRFLSHSVAGLILFGIGFHYLLVFTSHTIIVNQTIVWWSFMIGVVSHLVMDTFTHDGVPWLFPFPFHFGIPPVKFLRMKTGGFIETLVVFPGLLIVNGYIYASYYHKFLDFFRHYLT